tara:strand:- start:811 stop:3483 length:2673 start_codon:yes stop_codon:yes gene_type:complete
MALTQVSTNGIKNGTITGLDFATNIDLVDNQKIRFGTGNDLQIYHDGAFNKIEGSSAGNHLIFRPNASDEGIRILNNGAVELYHDGSKKLETKSYGIEATGGVYPPSNDSGQLGGSSLRWSEIHANDFVDLPDNGKIQLGNGDDLQIYHDGSKSVLADTGTGGLFIAGSSISLTNAGITETMLYAVPDGAVELYHDNSKKFETTSTGVTVTGKTTITDDLSGGDNVVLRLGNATGGDLQIYHDGSHSYVEDVGTGDLRLKGSTIRFRSTTSESMIGAFQNGAVEIYYDNSKKLETTSSGVSVSGDLNVGTFRVSSSSGNVFMADSDQLRLGTGEDFKLYHDGNNHIKTSSGYLSVEVANNTLFLDANETRMRSADEGEILAKFIDNGAVDLYYDNSKKFNTTSGGVDITGTMMADGIQIQDTHKINLGNSQDLQIYHDGSHSYIADAGTGNLNITASTVNINNAANSENIARFIQNGAVDLYYDGTLKANTRSDGFEIRQHLTMGDGDEIRLGNGSDLLIHHNGSHSIVHTNVGNLSLSGQNKVQLSKATSDGTVSYEFMVQANANGAVQLYYDNSLKLETHSSNGVQFPAGLQTPDSQAVRIGNSNDLLLFHDGNNSIIGNQTGVLIIASPSELLLRSHQGENMFRGVPNGTASLYYDNSLKFYTESTGSQFYGNLRADDNSEIRLGNSGDLQLYHDGSNSYVNDQGTGSLRLVTNELRINNSANNELMIYAQQNSGVQLRYDNSTKLTTVNAGVSIAGSCNPDSHNSRDLGASNLRWATFYVVNQPNVSDRNEKNTIQHTDLGLSFINKLNPVSFKWNDTSLGIKTRYGLIVQEVEEAIKELGKNPDNIGMIDKPDKGSMGLCTNELIAPLVKAIQELSAKVAALEAA